MIYITGDCHGSMDKFESVRFNLTSQDKIIVLGDFGAVFFNNTPAMKELIDNIEKPILHYLSDLPCEVLFIDGNHDNIDRLKDLPEIYRYGNKVGEITHNVFYLKRGNVYTIENKTFMCMGGATSIDRGNRTEGVNWWSDENPNNREWFKLMLELERVNNKVDYVLTHTPPNKLIKPILKWEMSCNYNVPEWKIDDGTVRSVDCPTARTLDIVSDKLDFKVWFFGHMHHNITFKDYPKYVCLYQSIMKLEDSADAYHKLLSQI